MKIVPLKRIVACSFVALSIISFCFSTAAAQASPKRLLGSFILQNKAYNYEFTMEASDNYSFLS